MVYGLLLSPIAALDVRHALGRATFDQVLFHERTIDAIVQTWPVVRLTDPEYHVAMTPGYHWVLAGMARLTGMGDPGLRLASLALTVAGLSWLGVLLGRCCGAVLGAALVLPLMGSMYVASASAWLLADNAGWLWVALLALAALLCKPTPKWALWMGVALLLAVWTRQNLLFLALPLWAAAWLREQPQGPPSANPFLGIPRRAWNVLPVALATLPAIASLVYLHRVWGGLVPYAFQGQYRGVNLSNIALQFAMLSVLSIFFLPAILGVAEIGWRSRCAAILRAAAPWMVIAAAIAGFAAALVPTTLDPKAGRMGLVWGLADSINLLGPIGHCNPVMVAAAAAGGALLALILACAQPRQRWILGAIYAGFGVAQAASSEVWQRYHEPFALIFLALATMIAVSTRRPAWRRPPMAQLVPIAVLASALALTTALVLWQREVGPWRQGASQTPVSSGLPEPPANQP